MSVSPISRQLGNFENPAITSIPIDYFVECDTHSTGGEHASKELGSWNQFLRNLRTTGDKLPEAIELPFNYYLESEQGGFYRVYDNAESSDLIAAMAVSPTKDGGLTVDAMSCKDARSLTTSTAQEMGIASHTATAVYNLLGNRILSDYSGLGPRGAKHLDFPFDNIIGALQRDPEDQQYRLNWGFMRGISEYALAGADRYRIPMPNIVVSMPDEMTDEQLEQLREPMPDDFTGVLTYNHEDRPDTRVQDFFRNRTLIGTMRTTREGSSLNLEATSASGQEIAVPDFGERFLESESSKRVRFLKHLAESEPVARQLILA